jgi:hypothetical protein
MLGGEAKRGDVLFVFSVQQFISGQSLIIASDEDRWEAFSDQDFTVNHAAARRGGQAACNVYKVDRGPVVRSCCWTALSPSTCGTATPAAPPPWTPACGRPCLTCGSWPVWISTSSPSGSRASPCGQRPFVVGGCGEAASADCGFRRVRRPVVDGMVEAVLGVGVGHMSWSRSRLS